MLCPMKFFTIGNNEFCNAIRPDNVSNFMKCNKEKCAWYCTYQNGKGECAIHSLPGLFDGLQDIAKEIGIK